MHSDVSITTVVKVAIILRTAMCCSESSIASALGMWVVRMSKQCYAMLTM